MPKLPILAFLFSACIVASVRGALVHRYSFNGNINDSVGGAHGMLIDGGQPNAVFAIGVLDVSSNSTAPYASDQTGAYVDLPGSIFSAAFLGGAAGELTLEMWGEASQDLPLASPFTLSNRQPSIGSPVGDSLWMTTTVHPQLNESFGVSVYDAPGENRRAAAHGPPIVGQVVHLAVAFQLTEFVPRSGRYFGGLSFYFNGELKGVMEYQSGVELSRMENAVMCLGRPVADSAPLLNGRFDEFRIYDARLNADEIRRSYLRGPNNVPEPHSAYLVGFAAMVGAIGRKRSQPLSPE